MIGITGGAGFIGQHIISSLMSGGLCSKIKVLDNFSPQVHEVDSKDLFVKKFPDVMLKVGDVCSQDDAKWLLDDVDILIHLAAETGTGQSMYNIKSYTETNIAGTATLLQVLGEGGRKLSKFILASSRSVYGEGSYRCCDACSGLHDKVISRKTSDMDVGVFDPLCNSCGCPLVPTPTVESCYTNPLSYYAETKLFQERQVELYREKYYEQLTILRFQNVYGEGQSLSNPYTGILAIFSNLAKVNSTINIFEDGFESRDFVHVSDVAAVVSAVVNNSTAQFDGTFNVGTGVPVSVSHVAERIKVFFDSSSDINVSGDYRVGDIRHNYACVQKLQAAGVDLSMFVQFEQGLNSFLKSVGESVSASFDYQKSIDELQRAGMYVSAEKRK